METLLAGRSVAHRVPPAKMKQLGGLDALVGQTPLLAIDLLLDGAMRTVYSKCEWKNLTGSIKDRMALHILRSAYEDGSLQPGDRIVEATSGNTGISFSALGGALGHPVLIFMPNWMSQERIRLIESYGAEVRLVTREEGGFLGSIAMAEMIASRERETFLPRQFSNCANVEAHCSSTGPELCAQLARHGLVPDAFVAGVGTGGTVMGVGRYFQKHLPGTRVHPVEPAESPTLTVGSKVGHHRIQGISDEFVPEIVKLHTLDAVLPIHDGDSILMAQRLSRELGLGVGISSGCNFLAAVRVAAEMQEDCVVTTVFADDNKKYLSTDLMREEPVRERYWTPRIELLGMRVL